MCLLVVATPPKAPVPWHPGSAPTSSLCKRLAKRMDLETCGHAPTRMTMCLLHGPDKGADVVVSRPVPSLGTSFPLTSVQFFMVLDNVRVPVLVAARTRGAPSLLAVTWPHVPSKASWLDSQQGVRCTNAHAIFLQRFHPPQIRGRRSLPLQ